MNLPTLSPPLLYLTYREAATSLRLSESMIRKLVRAKKLKITKFGRSARISVSELERIGVQSR